MDKKQEIYLKLRKIVSEKRKSKCDTSFSAFIDLYLKDLTPAKRPQFHNEMIGLINSMVHDSFKSPTSDTSGRDGVLLLNEGDNQVEGTVGACGDIREGGGAPTEEEKNKNITPPHFFPNF